MIYLAIGLVLLGLFVGGAGMRAHLRRAGAMWRPGAGVLALACWIGAAVLALREQWAPAIGFILLGGWLALSARVRAGQKAKPPAAGKSGMSRADAASILGVSESASQEEVQAAYLRLMRRAHPDSGGTTGLATQLNAARETLLKGR